jgi:lysozyme
MPACECAACGGQFSSLRAFDRHQTTDYTASPPVTCHAPAGRGLLLNSLDRWACPPNEAGREWFAAKGSRKGDPMKKAITTGWLEQAGLPVRSAQGLDVSNFQGQFNWAGAQGLSFGICRVTQGLGTNVNSPDPDLHWNWAQIAAQKLHRGGYHFLDPGLGGAAQAEYFIHTLNFQGLGTADMLWLDNETAGVTADSTSRCAAAFMHELDQLAPHNPRGVYTFMSFAESGHCAGLGHYPLWLARPGTAAPAAPQPWDKWAFWQWGLRNGIDADAYNGTAAELASWIRSFGPPPAPPPPPPPPPPGMAVQPSSVQGTARSTNARLSWSGAEHVTSFEVYLADQHGKTITKTELGAGETSYVFRGLHKSTQYKLGVLAKPAAPGTQARYADVTTRA